jgi:putative ABC transport system ATP-binding protein
VTNSQNDAIIQTRNLHRIYDTGNERVHAVNDVSLDIHTGQLTAIVGRSGAGKTTLLNLISGLDTPTQGTVHINDQNLFEMSEADRVQLRRQKIGFIFQSFGLLPLLSARENVGVPLRMMQLPGGEREDRVEEALEWVGLAKRMSHRPYELSGGEQQRVAIARALAARPQIILADEPTGQLDTHTGKRVLRTMRDLAQRLNITLVIVTHDRLVMRAADIIHELSDGQHIDSRTPQPVRG